MKLRCTRPKEDGDDDVLRGKQAEGIAARDSRDMGFPSSSRQQPDKSLGLKQHFPPEIGANPHVAKIWHLQSYKLDPVKASPEARMLSRPAWKQQSTDGGGGTCVDKVGRMPAWSLHKVLFELF